MTEENPEEGQEQFSKEEVDTLISEKLSEQEESFNTKMDELKEELKPEEASPPAENQVTKYVDEAWTPSNYNDMMSKVIDVVKEHVPQADAETITKAVKDSIVEEQEAVKTEAKQADEEWNTQVTDIKKEESLTDKQVVEILTKAKEWNKENPDGLITSMKLAHEHWKKDAGDKPKPRIPGAPTNNAEEESDQKIFASTDEAMAYWLQTRGE